MKAKFTLEGSSNYKETKPFPLLCVQIHEKTLERKSAAIVCKRFPGTHPHDAIARYLNEIHVSFNLDDNKLVATITDNGSNFVKAFKEFGVDVTDTCLLGERYLIFFKLFYFVLT